MKATGVVFTSSYQDGSPYASQVAPGLGAPYHQHLFSARLDMSVDGPTNAVDEMDIVRLPVGPDNPYGSAFTRRAHPGRPRVRGRPDRRRERGPGLADHQSRVDQPARPAGRLHTTAGERAAAAGRRVVVHRQAGRVRHPAPVGDPVRPGGALRRRRAASTSTPAEPGCRRSWARTATSTGRTSCCGTRSAHALPAPRGLAGHAGRPRGFTLKPTTSSTATRPSTSRLVATERPATRSDRRSAADGERHRRHRCPDPLDQRPQVGGKVLLEPGHQLARRPRGRSSGSSDGLDAERADQHREHRAGQVELLRGAQACARGAGAGARRPAGPWRG